MQKVMVNSAEHEILSAHKYKNTKKFGFFFQAQISLECLFLLINVKLLAFEHLLAGKIMLSVDSFPRNIWVFHFAKLEQTRIHLLEYTYSFFPYNMKIVYCSQTTFTFRRFSSR